MRNKPQSKVQIMPVKTIGKCERQYYFNTFTELYLKDEQPAGLSVPVVVVQYFPKIFTRELAKSLNEISDLNVREVCEGGELTPGTAWLARGGYHSEIQPRGNKILLHVQPV